MLKEQIFSSAPFAECHASSVLALRDGGFAAVWFGGSKEGNDDVGIWGAVRRGAWSAPVLLAKVSEEPHWNPVLFRDAAGRIMLFFKVGKTIADWRTFRLVSDDEAGRWSEPVELVPGDRTGGRGPVKNKPLLLADGAILAPGSVECGEWRSFTDRSTDGGRTWTRSALIDMTPRGGRKPGAIQPALWESLPGCVHMLLRTDAGELFRSDSADGGRSWCTAYPAGLPNNNSGIDLARLADGTLVLAANLSGENWGPRNRLALRFSGDGGAGWSEPYLLEGEAEGEFSYPAVIPLSGDGFAVTYTWKRRGIVFVRAALREFSAVPAKAACR